MKGTFNSFSQQILIWASSYLQVTRTDIKSCLSSNSVSIGPVTHDLCALERKQQNGVSNFLRPFFIRFSSYLQVKRKTYKVSTEFEFQQIRTLGFRITCPWALKKIPKTYNEENILQLFSANFNLGLFLLAGNEDRYKVLLKFEFCQYWTSPHMTYVPLNEIAKRYLQLFAVIFLSDFPHTYK